MTDSASAASLAAEFRLFARQLGERKSTPYLEAKYVAAHAIRRIAPRTRFDSFLVSFARSGPVGLWLADSFSGLLARKSTLRTKLVLVLALLECTAPSFERLDKPQGKGFPGLLSMALHGVVAAFGVILGALIFIPARLILGGEKQPANA